MLKKILFLFCIVSICAGCPVDITDTDPPASTATPVVSEVPTEEPTPEPTAEVTEEPTIEPTAEPTVEPTAEPTAEPTVVPTVEPTVEPTAEPTTEPTAEPTAIPTTEPTVEPTAVPTAEPTVEPTVEPTADPTPTPTADPTPTPILHVDGDWTYREYADHVSIVEYTGPYPTVMIPVYKYLEKPITEIEDNALEAKELTGISFYAYPQSYVTRIGKRSFYNNTNILCTLTLYEPLQIIDDEAFLGVKGLSQYLKIPNTVTYIGTSAFSGAYQAGATGTLTLSNTLQTIGGRAFAYCSKLIGTLTIPASVTSIGINAFRECTGFILVKSLNPVPPTAGVSIFYLSGITEIQVPAGSVNAYKVAPGWNTYSSIIVALP